MTQPEHRPNRQKVQNPPAFSSTDKVLKHSLPPPKVSYGKQDAQVAKMSYPPERCEQSAQAIRARTEPNTEKTFTIIFCMLPPGELRKTFIIALEYHL